MTKTKYKEIDHGSTVITVNNRPELLYVLEWCIAKNKKISDFMYKVDSFPFNLSVYAEIVGWTDLMDRALYYMPFREFLDKIENSDHNPNKSHNCLACSSTTCLGKMASYSDLKKNSCDNFVE